MALLIVAAIVIAFFAIAFALQNNDPVVINLLVWQYQGSLAIVLLATLAIGVLIGILVLIPSVLKRGWRVSRAKRQTADLESQLTDRERALGDQTRNTDRLRQSHENLLQAMGLTDANTNLLDAKVLNQTLSALINQMKLQPGNPQFDAIGLLVVDAHRLEPLGEVPTTAQQDAQLDAAIAHIIRRNVTLDTWLYCDSKAAAGAQFMCVLNGFDKAGLRQYGETLQTALTREPLTLADGSVVAVEAKVGGALADRAHPTNQEQLIIDKAYQALGEAGKRGLNPMKGSSTVKILQVTEG